jgi:tetratricopeptide (TPR) repeat protein
VTDPLRALWDFGDLDATEERLRARLAREETERGRAAVLTQLARVEGLRGRFEEGERRLVEAERLGGSGARVPLERGRLRRSAGDAAGALPLFVEAFELAVAAGEAFVAVDAAHMAALAADADGMRNWTQRGIELAQSSGDPEVAYWLGPLLNNLGWACLEAGEHEEALGAFRRALDARERDSARPYEREIARYALAKALRASGRADEAAAQLERAVAWAAETGTRDGYFHGQLAEAYAALGRDEEAREQARRALALVDVAEPERVARLRELAEAPPYGESRSTSHASESG